MSWPIIALLVPAYLLVGTAVAALSVRYNVRVFHTYDEQAEIIGCLLLWPAAVLSLACWLIVYCAVFVCYPFAWLAAQISKRVPRK